LPSPQRIGTSAPGKEDVLREYSIVS
jgi:hypothetical protein